MHTINIAVLWINDQKNNMTCRQSSSLIFLVMFLGCTIFSTVQSKTEVDLHNELFNTSQYNVNVRPRRYSNETVQLTITWDVTFLIKYLEKDGIVLLSVSCIMKWMDDFLTWTPEDYGNTTNVLVTADMVWSPELEILTRHGSVYLGDGLKDEWVRIQHDGEVTLQYKGVLHNLCVMDPEMFPFDQQSCLILVKVAAYTKREVTIALSTQKIRNSFEYTHSIWNVDSSNSLLSSNYTESIVRVSLILSRKPLYYLFTMIVPSEILSVLILCAFFIRIDDGEKISFGITIFLALVVFLAKVGDMIPENSNAVALIGMYYTLLMCSSAVTIANAIVWSFMIKRELILCIRGRNTAKVDPIDEKTPVDNNGAQYAGKIFDIISFCVSLGLIIAANSMIFVHL